MGWGPGKLCNPVALPPFHGRAVDPSALLSPWTKKLPDVVHKHSYLTELPGQHMVDSRWSKVNIISLGLEHS